MTRKWDIADNQSNVNFDLGNEIIYNTEVSASNLCGYSDFYILARGDIITTANNNRISVVLKNCALFTKYITKIDGTIINDAEDLDLVMPIYNLIEYSSNYSDTTGS